MSLNYIEINYKYHWLQPRNKRRLAHLTCDHCQKSCVRKFEIHAEYNTKGHFFCRRDCLNFSQREGTIKQYKEKLFQEKYGVSNPFENEEIKEKIRQTNIRIFGVKNVSQSSIVQIRKENTNLTRFGTKNASSSNVIKEKRRQTFQERYGVDNAMQIPKVLAAFDFQAANKKAWETQKRNGNANNSRPENILCNLLIEHFGKKDIERWVEINGWYVDFYIKSLDRYIELDGVYWHGLDRQKEDIAASSKPRDISILKHFEKDRRQDVWFRDNGLVLERITDIDFCKALKEGKI